MNQLCLHVHLFVQAIDMNQDGTLEDAFKQREMLEEFGETSMLECCTDREFDPIGNDTSTLLLFGLDVSGSLCAVLLCALLIHDVPPCRLHGLQTLLA